MLLPIQRRWLAAAIILPLAGLIFSTAPLPVQGQADQCPALVNDALNQLETRCEGTNRNFACYGNNNVLAQFTRDVAPEFFTQPGEIAQLIELENIETQPLDLENNTWGVALMNVQANLPNTLPGQSVVMLLFGDTYVEDDVDPSEAFNSETEILVQTDRDIPLRVDPDAGSEIVGNLSEGTEVPADAMAPNGWVRVAFNDQFGWIPPQVIAMPRGLNLLPTVTGDTLTPMQSFFFSTGIGSASCEETPDTLVVQGPEELFVDIKANGADIRIGSTIALITDESTTPPQMEVLVLEDEAEITCENGGTVIIQQGESSTSDLSPLSDFGVVEEVDNREALCNWTEPELQDIDRILAIAGPACDASTGLLNYDLDCGSILEEEETPTPPPPVVFVPQAPPVEEVLTEEPIVPTVVAVEPTVVPPPDDDDDDGGDDDDGDDDPVDSTADVGLSVGASVAIVPSVGDTVNLTLTATNQGDVNLTDIVVSDNLAGFGGDLTVTVGGVPSGTSYDSSTNQWTIDSLAVGESATLTFATIVNAVRTYNVQFTLASSNPADENSGNNTATTSFTSIAAPVPDVGLSAGVSDTAPVVGDPVTITLTATNTGNEALTNVVIGDNLGSFGLDLAFTPNAPAGTSYNASSNEWTITSLAVGDSVTLTFTATPAAEITYNVDFSLASSTPADQNTTNDTASTSFTASALFDVAVSATVSDTAPTVGDTITITVTATNAGDQDLTNVVISDNFSSFSEDLSFVETAPSGTSYDSGTGQWTITSLPVGDALTLSFATDVEDAGTVDIDFALVSSVSADENTTNDTASISYTAVAAPQPDIEVTINGSATPNITADEDTDITFTITVTNISTTTDAEGVVVDDDILGTGGITAITFDGDTGSTVSAGSYDDAGTWTVGTLTPGSSATLTIPVTVNVGASGGSSPGLSYGVLATGSTTNGDADGSNDFASGFLNVNFNNVTITVTGPGTIVSGNDTFILTITATNNGDSDLADVEVSDDIGDTTNSSGTTRDSASATAGTAYDTGSGIWTIGDLSVGTTVTVDITVGTDAGFPGPKDITAQLDNTTPDDLDSSDDSETINVSVSG